MVSNDLMQRILNLDAADREYVRNAISATLSDGMPPQLSPQDVQVLLQRVEHYDKHSDELMPWHEVKARLAKQRAEE